MFILQTGGPSRGMTSLRVNDRGELIKGRGDLEQGLQVCSHLVTVGNVAESLTESVKSVRSVSDSRWNIQTGVPALKVVIGARQDVIPLQGAVM